MSYSIVLPEDFTEEQRCFVEKFKETIQLLSDQTNDTLFGVKDVTSRHILSTDHFAKIVSLQYGRDVEGRMDYDMPCEGTAQFADCFIREDRQLIHGGNINKSMTMLNVHHYGDGLHARVFSKHLLKHFDSNSVLGTIYHGYEIQIANFLSLMPNYILEFGGGCSIEQVEGSLDIDSVTLTEYEQEICFLLLLNWDFGQIAAFMNKYRPKTHGKARVADSIIKSKNRICEKIGLPSATVSALRDALIGLGVHRKMPQSLFKRLIGSKPIG
ncbi:hypothetical protein [Paludibacterium paludis]|uniref:Uncharacterized protein n=1 Tax=Paludibacterium paludis TaxID=1225769 RepID=A0A918P0S5_9NEIS|nr:hypothetical protein [Paludibacterium paludis]GGY10557.1 hypothetical protein GCM10011289_11650 [Paludibacterium paludis]